MIDKIKKFLSFSRIILQKPSLVNLTLDHNIVQKEKFLQKYPKFSSLPQIELEQVSPSIAESVESFLLDGSSLITDLQLLSSLAKRDDVRSYFEIGTWRGESVYNVAKSVDDCSTLNLSEEEMNALGWEPLYAEQHGILSKKNPKINHLFGNTLTFDFAALGKKYDLIFIDGDHSYEMVLHDTKKIFEHLVHEQTIVVWHDYAYSPQKVRYEVFGAILDGLNPKQHQNLYHVKNTMCAVFIPEHLQFETFDEMKFPETLFEIGIKKHAFN